MRASPAWICACVAIAGCGGASSDRSERPPSVAAASRATIAIAQPQDGSRLRASAKKAGRLSVRTRMIGTAQPGSVVWLGATCVPRPCVVRTTTTGDGRWTARMTLTAIVSGSFVTIDARAGSADAPDPAVVTVALAGPPDSAAAAERRRAKRRAARRHRASKPPPPPPRRSLPHDVLVIGDSLALGMSDSLRAALPGWRVEVDGRIGRPLAEGMGILAQRDAPAIVALSLFTNDDPRNVAQLVAAVRSTAARPGGCVVWATIVAPPYNGVSFQSANDALARLAADPRLARRLRLVDWRALVARNPSFLEGDAVHGTPAGYGALGRAYADAIRACASAG